MDIPAKLVIRKMDSELDRLKEKLVESGSSSSSSAGYREHVHALKTYCDLLLDSESDVDSGRSRLKTPVNVQHASVEDVKARMSEGLVDKKSASSGSVSGIGSGARSGSEAGSRVGDKRSPEAAGGAQGASAKSSSDTIYDEGDNPNSDSLFDF
ncbi:DUF5327 family protein [Salipaludibacillus sp. HK11]|uniref:DUF5327 family protein n=1 Tax=Salipaludibacillus sp. HK11 TaxID=3394320 RepID=UPI0039FCA1F9